MSPTTQQTHHTHTTTTSYREALDSWIFFVKNGRLNNFQEKFGVLRLASALLALGLPSAQGDSELIL